MGARPQPPAASTAAAGATAAMAATFRFSSAIACFLLLLCAANAPGAAGNVVVVPTNATYMSRIAGFGPRIGQEPVRGILVSMFSFNQSNVLGCSLMETTPNVTRWIALVQRGDCTFVTKVRMMQKAGAIAVIVGDNKPSSSLIMMQATEDTSDITVPSVFVSKASYESLIIQSHPKKNLGAEDDEYFLEILIDMNQYLQWPMFDIVIITIIAPAVIMIFLYAIWRLRRRQQRKREVAPPSVVVSLPVRVFSAADKGEDETCPICLEEFKDGDELRILPCKHEYHVSCIDQWLTTRKRFCPLCKMDACPNGASEDSPLIIRTLTPTTSSIAQPTPAAGSIQEDASSSGTSSRATPSQVEAGGN